MFKTKSALNYFVGYLAIVGLVFIIGCGSSVEKQKMSTFLQEYSKTLDEYVEVSKTTDNGKKNELEGKLDSFVSSWTDLKIEMVGDITPQTLDKLEQEYQKITKKYATLAGKS